MNARVDVSPASVSPEASIGSIAVHLPGATAVFRRLKLDFCCGGNVALSQAVADKGLALDSVLAELSALQQPTTTPEMATPAQLVDHIVSCFHDVHRQQLPELIRMARRVETVHRDNPHVPAGLGDLLEAMQAELFSHMHKEEAILFPMLKAGGHAFVSQPIGMMRAEHVDHGAELERLMALTHDATPPAGACNTWRALYTGIARFADDLISHIHTENNVLFPQFEPAAAGNGDCGSSCGCS
ncbi:MAG: iron-sulfur cluster repair protein YtfE [Burkholderiaceae bacterium]|jgi:regulator of cell morphogenesis and NO signaling|nr:iron-sulfur cluster repair protein YtfE [Burkholderiaceae bacterium]